MYSILLLVSAVFGAGVRYRFQEKIYGGSEVSINSFSYQASLERIGIDSCGAVIIAANKVLTAGHCIHNHNDYVVRCGSDFATEGGQVAKVSQMKLHPGYNPNGYDNDVAVIYLEKGFELGGNSKCAPIRLSKNMTDGNRTLWVSGWGVMENNRRPKKLHAAAVQEFSRAECQKAYSLYTYTENMLCCGGKDGDVVKDACNGDSGGPLVDKVANELVGISSWGLGCGRVRKPGVYARIAALRDWIVAQ